jgi:uncharacterized protein YjeT (DUF2065 family)
MVLGIIDKMQEFILAMGPHYVRIIAGSLVIMIIGATLFFIGYAYIGFHIVLFPSMIYTYYPYMNTYEYRVSLSEVKNVFLGNTPIEIDSVRFRSPGYLILEIVSSCYTCSIRINIIDTSTGRLVYSIVFYGSGNSTIPITRTGTYRIEGYIESTSISSTVAVVNIKAIIMREKSNIIISRWLQAVGLAIVFIGLLIFIFAPRIARKSIETTYMMPPREIREDLARMSYLKIFEERETEESRE